MSATIKAVYYKKICNTPFKINFSKKGRIDFDIELENSNTGEKFKGTKQDTVKIEEKKVEEPVEPQKGGFFSRFVTAKPAAAAAVDLTMSRDLLETALKGSDPNLICDTFFIYEPAETDLPVSSKDKDSVKPDPDLGGLELMIFDQSDPNNIIKYKAKVKKQLIQESVRMMNIMTPEPIKYVAKTDFLNNWTNFSIKNGTEETLGYYKHMQRVYLSGLVCGGEVGEKKPIFTLPETYRPPKNLVFLVDCGRKAGSLDISPTGEVCLMKGNNGFVSLSGISFRADC